jgi:hypothetical protein
VFSVVCAKQQQRGCVFCAWSVPKVYNRYRKPLTGLEFRSSMGTAVWPEGGLEDLVCDVTCAVVQQYWETFTVSVL